MKHKIRAWARGAAALGDWEVRDFVIEADTGEKAVQALCDDGKWDFYRTPRLMASAEAALEPWTTPWAPPLSEAEEAAQ